MGKCNPVKRVIPAVFAWVLLLVATGAYFAFPCRYLLAEFGIAVPIVQGLVTFFVILNFALATFINPGIIPKATSEERKSDGITSPMYQDVEINGVRVRLKWCSTCQFYRPPRCVHCGVCDTCIEIFDHHCPWVNNCIGRRNYRYFFMFLLWLSIHMIVILSFCVMYLSAHLDNLKELDTLLTLSLIAIIIVLFIPIFGLTSYHVMLLVRGRTTNEQVTGKFVDVRNPYSQGCCKNIYFSLCSSLPPKYYTEKTSYTSINRYSARHFDEQKSLNDTATSLLNSSQGKSLNFKFADHSDFVPSKPLHYEAPYRGHLHLSLSDSSYTKSRGSRALTPPVPIRFDCSRRSLPPHNRLHYAGAVFHTDPQKMIVCTSSYPTLVKYPPPPRDSCCLGNQTVDKLQEIANRTMGSTFSPNKMQPHKVAERTPGNRPLSFVKAMEMSEALEWNSPPKSDQEISYEISV